MSRASSFSGILRHVDPALAELGQMDRDVALDATGIEARAIRPDLFLDRLSGSARCGSIRFTTTDSRDYHGHVVLQPAISHSYEIKQARRDALQQFAPHNGLDFR